MLPGVIAGTNGTIRSLDAIWNHPVARSDIVTCRPASRTSRRPVRGRLPVFDGENQMSFTLPTLPYAHDALAPYMSRETLEYHHDKHHLAYVNNANNLIKGTEWE